MMKNYFLKKINTFFNKNIKTRQKSLTQYPADIISNFKSQKSFSINHLIKESKNVNGKECGNFLVLCLGKSGSTWLAAALNLHPDVTCSGGIDHPVNSLNYPYNQDLMKKYLKGIKSKTAVRYGAISLEESYAKKIKMTEVNYGRYAAGTIIKRHLKDIGKNIDIPSRYNIEDLYPVILKELKEIPFFKAKFYGNVHAMNCRKFIESLKKNKNHYYKNLKIVDLISNPVKRMESIKNAALLEYKLNFGNYVNILQDYIDDNTHIIKKIENEYKVDFSDIKNRIIFHNYYFFNYPLVHAMDIKSLNVPRIKFESIKNNPISFKKLFNYLTDDKLSYTKEYENQVFSYSMKGFGRHLSKEENLTSAEDIYSSWSDWERKLFFNVMKQFELENFYKQYDYDLSFIKKI